MVLCLDESVLSDEDKRFPVATGMPKTFVEFAAVQNSALKPFLNPFPRIRRWHRRAFEVC